MKEIDSYQRDLLRSGIHRMLKHIGEDPEREGLKETPDRVIKSWNELYSGYSRDVAELMKTFKEGACDEMVILRDIEFFSFCEHHMLPFFGKASIAYIPNGKVIGVSKLARLLELFSRRLQIQERIGQQITEALMEHLECKGAGCLLEAKHFCMVCRGVQKQNSVMITSDLKGCFKEPATRAEFLHLSR